MDKVLNLKNLASIELFSSKFARLGDNYILSHIDTDKRRNEMNDAEDEILPGLNSPLRLNGMLLILVNKGCIRLQVNTESYQTKSGGIIAVRPGTLVTFTHIAAATAFTILFISSTFMNSINIDLNSIEVRPYFSQPRTVMQLERSEVDVVRKYFDLLDANAAKSTGSLFATRIARTLIGAIVYELIRFSLVRNSVTDEKQERHKADLQGRAHNYVYRFMQLLQIHYGKERNLDFYAEQLCITPKYLSMLTKEITGSSASEWMDRIVIQEAKNMLRFSDKSIQEVAYALSFPSQSAFGKYFKRVTGLSPSEYLKD